MSYNSSGRLKEYRPKRDAQYRQLKDFHLVEIGYKTLFYEGISKGINFRRYKNFVGL
jgi:hypothetical protein